MSGFFPRRSTLFATAVAAAGFGAIGFASIGLGAVIVGETRRIDLGPKAAPGIDALKTQYKRQAVDNVGAIASIMDEIDRFTAAIADAVSQQNAAANEISRSIGHAAAGTESVARSIAGTATATENTNRSADLVLATARDLSDQAVDLRASVDRFLSNVAA